MVKWQGHPLRLPLLRLPPDLAPLAIECFDCILRYCGDLVPDPELTEVKCVYTVLMVCYTYDWGYISMDYIVFFLFVSIVTNIWPWGMRSTASSSNKQQPTVQRVQNRLNVLGGYSASWRHISAALMHFVRTWLSTSRLRRQTVAELVTELLLSVLPTWGKLRVAEAGRMYQASRRSQRYRLDGMYINYYEKKNTCYSYLFYFFEKRNNYERNETRFPFWR